MSDTPYPRVLDSSECLFLFRQGMWTQKMDSGSVWIGFSTFVKVCSEFRWRVPSFTCAVRDDGTIGEEREEKQKEYGWTRNRPRKWEGDPIPWNPVRFVWSSPYSDHRHVRVVVVDDERAQVRRHRVSRTKNKFERVQIRNLVLEVLPLSTEKFRHLWESVTKICKTSSYGLVMV